MKHILLTIAAIALLLLVASCSTAQSSHSTVQETESLTSAAEPTPSGQSTGQQTESLTSTAEPTPSGQPTGRQTESLTSAAEPTPSGQPTGQQTESPTSAAEPTPSGQPTGQETETPTTAKTTVDPVETDETPVTTPEEIDFDAMRHLMFKEYPSVSNLSWTIDYYLEEFKLEYQRLEERWATLDYDEISAQIGMPFTTPTLEEMLDWNKVKLWNKIDPLSELIVSSEQRSLLQVGMSRTAVVAALGGYPNYWTPRDFGEDSSDYYYLEDGTILKLNYRYYRTRNKEEAGPDAEHVDLWYWSRELESYEIISFDDLKRDAEREAELNPKNAVHYDPRKDKDCKLPIKDHWPEIFVTKYGIE